MKVTPKLKMNKEEQKTSAMIQIHREPTYDHDMNEYNANFKFFFFFFLPQCNIQEQMKIPIESSSQLTVNIVQT